VFLNLRITYKNDTTLDIKAEWDDFIAFEDEFDLPFTVVIDPKKSRLKHSTWLAWHSLSREKKTEKPFTEWMIEIGSVNFVPDSEVQDVLPLESKARTGA
jgi:hypothetical protein